MKRAGILGIVFLIFVVVGIYERGHHRNLLHHYMQTGDSRNYSTGAFDIEQKDVLDYERDYYKNADLVVQAELAGDRKACFGSTKIPLKILEVYKGEGLDKGDEIQYISHIYFIKRDKLLNAYTNFMREDTPYLVFLNKPGIRYSSDNIYLAPESSLFPYFAMTEIENVYGVAKRNNFGGMVNSLEMVRENEFFITDEKTLELMLDFKKEILEVYAVK